MDGGVVTGLIDAAAREATLLAAIGFLIGGIDDLIVDIIYFARLARRHLRGMPELTLAALPPPSRPIAVFVPAWDEAAVIGAMLRTALARWTHPELRLYVGVYPNDSATIDRVAGVALADPRVRLVINHRPGPTTKADCLNSLWLAMLLEEERGIEPAAAIVLHDAGDVVHAGELAIYDVLIGGFDAVQIPVLPLPDRTSRFVGGTYLDEFAEAHAKQLVVRQAVGAGLPFAGVGCAVSRAMMGRIADIRHGQPFDAGSLTEDYELGLTVAAMGGRIATERLRETPGGAPVAVRALFPGKLAAAVRQKSRWMVGIALAGWDRVGWRGARSIAEVWMRMRDRRQPIAVLLLAVAYCALLLWGLSYARTLFGGAAPTFVGPELQALLSINIALFAWRLLMRAGFVGHAYGVQEALLSLPRFFVGNIIALIAARRAVFRYAAMLRGGAVRWDKTDHSFPSELAERPA